jgi:hypothetical protein
MDKHSIKISILSYCEYLTLNKIALLFIHFYILYYFYYNEKKYSSYHNNINNQQDNTVSYYKQDNITLVTALYMIKSKRPINTYINWIDKLLKINSSFVIYTHKSLIDIIKEMRPISLLNKTKFIVLEMEEFYSYKKFGLQFQETFKLELEHRVLLHPPLYLVWAEKCSFLKKAIKNNYFNSSCFYWIDAGFFRDKKWRMEQYINNWPSIKKCKSDPRVIFSLLRNFTKLEIKGLFNFNITEHINLQRSYNVAGGMFGGRADYVMKFANIYYNTLTLFIKHKIYIGKDQNIFTFIGFLHPEIVNLIYTKMDYYYFVKYLS